jgi:hypothetical protein
MLLSTAVTLAANSVGGDFPNSSNTGVPAGVLLKPSGAVEVNTPGAVVSGLDITGYLYINAPNVTVRNVRVNATTWGAIIVTANGGGVLIVSDLLTAPCGDIDESADVDRSGGIGSHIWSTIYLTLRGHVAE